MIAVGLWLILGGYALAYWGQYMIRGQHVSLACLAIGVNC